MNENKIIKVAAVGFIGLVVAPVVINAGIKLSVYSATCISNLVEKIKHDKKIREGLKDGSIVEIDGQYYEVKKEDVEEA